jgi:hypothetical protein
MPYFPLEIPVLPYMRGHAFDGRVMFSAAELLHLLAAAVKDLFPGLSGAQAETLFPRFLLLPPETGGFVSVLMDVEAHAEGDVSVKLLNKFQSPSGLSRLREHVRVRFLKEKPMDFSFPTFGEALELSGSFVEIPAEKIYEELVPFGPAYRNIRGNLRLNAQAALARIQAGTQLVPGRFPGVPLVSDAAFHAACVWGQRYHGKVVFPVGFKRRCFQAETKPEIPYLCRVMPAGTDRETLIFDLWIYDLKGMPCEAIAGLRMADVTDGRIQPPLWVREES